jgi:hypothetical protein
MYVDAVALELAILFADCAVDTAAYDGDAPDVGHVTDCGAIVGVGVAPPPDGIEPPPPPPQAVNAKANTLSEITTPLRRFTGVLQKKVADKVIGH